MCQRLRVPYSDSFAMMSHRQNRPVLSSLLRPEKTTSAAIQASRSVLVGGWTSIVQVRIALAQTTRPSSPARLARARVREAGRGRAFGVTGRRSVPRQGLKVQIGAAGGAVASSVSGRTDFLVAGEKPGSKRTKAEELGVQILDEAGLAQLLSDE